MLELKVCQRALGCGESISHSLALPVEGQRRVQGATGFHGEISLSYLQMPATGRIKKGSPSTRNFAENHLLRGEREGPRSFPAWEGWNPCPPAPPVRAGTGQSRTCRQQERKADLGACLTLWDPAALDAGLCFQEHFLAVLFVAMTDCHETHKGVVEVQKETLLSCRRPLIKEYTLQQYAERCNKMHQDRLSLPEKPAFSSTGDFVLWVSLFLFLSYHMCVVCNGHFTASLVSLTGCPSSLFTWCKHMIQMLVPKYGPNPCPMFNACSIFYSALTNTELRVCLSQSSSTASLCKQDWSYIQFSVRSYPVP